MCKIGAVLVTLVFVMQIAFVVAGFPSRAFSCASLAGSIDTQYNARQLFVSGSYAYVCCTSKLFVLDVRTPAKPKFVCSPLLSNGNAQGVYVVGNYAYIVGGGKFQIMDFSKISNPEIIGSSNISESIKYIYVNGNYAYICGGTVFQVVNVSSPQLPTLSGSLNSLKNAYSLSFSGTHIYIADSESGLYSVDISDPNSPRVVGEVETPSGRVQDVFISGSYAYLAAYDGGLVVVDITDPTDPTVASSLGLPDRAIGIYIYQSYAFLAWTDSSYAGGLYVVDISDPNTPLYVESINSSCTRDVHGETSYVCFTDRSGNLNVVDASGCFSNVPKAPTVTTISASSVTSTSATVNGTVNPNGVSTSYYFQYGTSGTYGFTTTTIEIGSGTGTLSVSAGIAGLSSNTLYNYRIVAANSVGTSYGSDRTFLTKRSDCIYVGSDLSISIPCVQYNGVQYILNLKYYTDPALPAGVYWKLDSVQEK